MFLLRTKPKLELPKEYRALEGYLLILEKGY
ncbi:hypothetical protein MY3296_005494 [Beauveria thailandica]